MPSFTRPAILFDLDGTLVDSIRLIIESAQHALASREGPMPSADAFASGIGLPLTEQFGPYCSSPDELQFLIAKYREYQLANHDRLTTVYDGIADVVSALHDAGHPMAVVTSKIGHLARRALVHVGLSDRFSILVGSDATRRHKPEPEPLLLALEELGLRPVDALYVGDSPYDMRAARAAGVTAVGALWGAYERSVLEGAGADHLIAQPDELLPLVASRHVVSETKARSA